MHDEKGTPSKKAEWSLAQRQQFIGDVKEMIRRGIRPATSASAEEETPAEALRTSADPRFDVDLSGFVIPAQFDLSGIASGNVDLQSAIFHGPVLIRGSSFYSIRLARAQFRDWFHIDHTDIRGRSYLKGAVFFGESHFGPALTLHGDFFLRSAHFYNRTFFWGIEAGAGASFWNGTFSDDVSFVSCNFRGYTVFRNTVFKGEAQFSGSQIAPAPSFFYPDTGFFRGPCVFHRKLNMSADDEIAFGSSATFSGVLFQQDADFRGRRFAGRATFRRACFNGAPLFHDATLPADVDFRGAQFNARAPSGVDPEKHNEIESTLELAYRTLRRAARDQGDYEREIEFGSYEFEARRRRTDISHADRVAILFFRLLTKYNQSLSWPVWIWAAGTVVLTGLLWAAAAADGLLMHHRFPSYAELISSTWVKFLPPPSGWMTADVKAVAAMLHMHENMLRIFAAVQIIWTAAIFTLFILTLRRRFVLLSN
ncbi:MAG TPA: pentapeptide repeat-containing protein [Chthoniobacterales bacterium]